LLPKLVREQQDWHAGHRGDERPPASSDKA
jgi:hypothetical protein